MTHPLEKLGMRQLSGVEQTIQAGGLGNESAFFDVVEMPVVEDTSGRVLPAFGDRRYLETLPTRPFLVGIGIISTNRSITLTHPNRSRKEDGMPFLRGSADKPKPEQRTIPVETSSLVINLALMDSSEPSERLGMFRTFVGKNGTSQAIPDPQDFADKSLDRLGVEVDLRTGRGQIVGHARGEPEAELITGARFNVQDVGRPMLRRRIRLRQGSKLEPDEQISNVMEVDEQTQTAVLAMDFVLGTVAAARNHLASQANQDPPEEESAEIAS